MNLRKFATLGLLILGFLALAACEVPTTTQPTTAPVTTVTTTTQPTTTTTTTVTLSDAEKVEEVLEDLTLGDISGVTADLTLPSPDTYGVVVTWATSDADIISTFGEVTIPDYTDGDQTVTLTATVILGAVTETKEFVVTVLAQSAEDFLAGAANAIIITGADAITTNFLLPSLVRGASVTWTSDDPTIAAIAATTNAEGYYLVTVTRPKVEEGGENTTITLTATLTIDETTITATKTVRVIAEPPATIYTSFETLHETAVLNDYVDVTGIVYSVFKLGYFLVDGDGKYIAVYTTETNAGAVTFGDQVRIKGLYKNYNTLYQISNLTYQEVISHDNAYTVTPIVLDDPADLLAVNSSDRLIHGQIFTITVTPQIRGSYGNVYLFDGETQIATVYYNSLAASIDVLESFVGQMITINVTYYTFYTGSSVLTPGVPEVYITFDGTADDVTLPELTDAEKLAADQAALALAGSVYGGSNLTLAATGGYLSTITWAITTGSEYASIAAGKVTFVDVTAVQTVVLQATLSLGAETPVTKDFTVTVNPITTSTIAAVNGGTTGNVYQIEGVVYFLISNGYYVFDATGMIFVYSTPTGLALGDQVLLTGTLAVYNGENQLSYANLKTKVSTGNPYAQTALPYVPGTTDLVAGQTYTVTGTVKIAGGYNNVYVYDGETVLFAIYYRSTTNDSYNALKAVANKEVVFNAVYYNTGNDSNAIGGSNCIFFVYQEGAAGISFTDSQKAADDVANTVVKTSVVAEEVVNLPTVATNGSAITWAILSGNEFVTSLVGNVITYANVVVPSEVVLTATYTYTPTVGDPIVATKDYTITISTYEQKLAEDLANLTVQATATEFDVITLPTVGANGSAITWVLAATTDATLATNVLTLNYKGAAYSVSLTATLTLSTLNDTKDFTIAVAAVVPLTVTQVYDEIIALGTATASINGPVEFLQGTILGFKWKSGFSVYEGIYVTDGVHVVYVYTSSTATTAYAVGDVVLIKGQIMTYYYLPEVSNVTILQKVDGATPATFETVSLSIEQIYSFTNTTTPYYSNKITVVGTLVVGSGDNSTWLIDGAGRKLVFSRIVSSLASLSALNGKEVVFTGFLNDYYSSGSYWRITGANSTFVLTDAQKAADDAATTAVKVSVVAEEVVELPTVGAYGSTITWAIKSGAENITSLVGNVVTYANVAVTSEAVLTATYTYTPTVGDPIVTVKDYTISISTLEVKLAADKAALTVADQLELTTVTLPTSGANGTAISWALAETTDAALAVNVLTLNYKGTAYTVTLTATLTISTFTDTKEFVVAVGTQTIVTEIGALNEKTDGVWTVPDGAIWIRGVVVGLNGTSGVFIQDASGDGMYCYQLSVTGLAVGDDIIVTGNLIVYNSVREMSGCTLKAKLGTGVAVVKTTMTVAEVEAILPTYWEYQGFYASVTGLTIDRFSGNYVYLNWVTVEANEYYLSFNYKTNYGWWFDAYQAGDVLGELSFVFYNIYSTYTYNINLVTGAAMTDAQKVEYDASTLLATLELTGDWTLPTPKYAAYDISAISVEVQPYLVDNGTGLTVTLPETDAIGTFTITVTSGAVTQDVVVNVTVKAMSDAQKVTSALADLPDALVVRDTMALPALTFGATYGTFTIAPALTSNLSEAAGVFTVTRPLAGAAAVTGTVTVNISVNAASGSKDITVTVMPFAADLFISYYMEGDGGNKKILAIYNDTGADVDLSAYRLGAITNPSSDPVASAMTVFALSGTLGHGKACIVYHADLANSGATGYLAAFAADLATAPAGTILFTNAYSFNGERSDIMALTKNVEGVWTFIDKIGVFEGALASGSTAWETAYTKNHTLVRNETIVGPTATVLWTEWTVLETNGYDKDALFSWK